MKKNVIIIGGGAAGFFAAVNMAEFNPYLQVTILEKGGRVLEKVKVSGGGRCNVTHACFEPKELIKYYPRGKKELLGPFHQFMTGDTMEWFENRGVELKIEEDGRVFPVSNSSLSIIDCLENHAKRLGVNVKLHTKVDSVEAFGETFHIKTENELFVADKLLIATGSNSKIWDLANKLGHTIVKPVPSLFTFKINDSLIKDLPGLSVPKATVSLPEKKLESSGPILITHWGLSGPAILKLSAIAAIYFAEQNYHLPVLVNWLSEPYDQIFENLLQLKRKFSKRQIGLKSVFEQLPNRLWQNFISASNINSELRWADVSNKSLEVLAQKMTRSEFMVDGKTTFKEEFVTAGGIDLKEIDFKRFESKIHPNLFFAGETLNIDAVTGGFNFQNAWTGGYIAARAIAEV
ncbi:BaiN/RdsA family NAD(P)/FAD-dependent oxidoreductase [Namhaeicola litoreus]|uniref:NAD(P)/FAD-dependent oxidoreductase n=1 Tax=Namhaeicola litoreus TaxID=1052145 RepID=A0ABW3XZ08_9FLAO